MLRLYFAVHHRTRSAIQRHRRQLDKLRWGETKYLGWHVFNFLQELTLQGYSGHSPGTPWLVNRRQTVELSELCVLTLSY